MTNQAPATVKLTVICTEHSALQPLIYCIDIPEYLTLGGEYAIDVLGGDDFDDVVQAAVAAERSEDCGMEILPEDITLLFAFAGDVQTAFDWRD